MGRHKTLGFLALQNKGSFPWQPVEGLVMDSKVLARAELGITAQKRKPELCYCLCKRFPTSTEPVLATDESLSFTNTRHVNKNI